MGSFAPRSVDPVVGMLVDGRYRVTGVIARGGMATVYRADDTRLDRLVALKVMHRSFAEDPGFVARFEREARAAAKLNHPHVVGVFDQGAHEGLVWLAMDYVPGYPLREVIRVHAPLDPDRALGVIEQILSGLGAAHSAGFVHRDIKPENVLMTPEGTMKLTDFGLARALMDDDPSAATKGVLIGTVAYLAPEQVESGHADERSDIYATGIVLYELLTGTVPFDGPTPLTVAYRHVNDRVPAPSASVPGIPAEVDALVLRATARDPADRFASATAFLQAAQAVEVLEQRTEGAAGTAGGTQSEAALAHPTAVTALSSSQTGESSVDVAGPSGSAAANHPSETDTPDDEWERIAAVATTTVTPGIGLSAGVGSEAAAGVFQTESTRPAPDPSTQVIGTSVVSTATDVVHAPAVADGGPTTADVGPTAAVVPTTGAPNSPSVPRGATPLRPVTRKPPPGDDHEASAPRSVKSITRFGRTRLTAVLIVLVTLMAAGGWWLGMRHNASEVSGSQQNWGTVTAASKSLAATRAPTPDSPGLINPPRHSPAPWHWHWHWHWH